MSANNSHERKAERRAEREVQASNAESTAALEFALQMAQATKQVPIDTLERSIEFLDAKIQPGVPLDDLLSIEVGLRVMRATLTYRKALEDIRGIKTTNTEGTE